MRSTTLKNGHTIILSNEEYTLLKKIQARGFLAVDSIDPYYQEIGEHLTNKSIVNKIEKNGKDYFVVIK